MAVRRSLVIDSAAISTHVVLGGDFGGHCLPTVTLRKRLDSTVLTVSLAAQWWRTHRGVTLDNQGNLYGTA
jgi:hypothetical protein